MSTDAVLYLSVAWVLAITLFLLRRRIFVALRRFQGHHDDSPAYVAARSWIGPTLMLGAVAVQTVLIGTGVIG